MPFYRLYFLHRHSGHIERVETLPAGDDVEAICQVQQMRHDTPLELWRDGRKVRRFDAKSLLRQPAALAGAALSPP